MPIEPQAIEVLEEIKELGFSDQYVFFNASTRKIATTSIILRSQSLLVS
ncbi:MAG: hypothetical protein R3250_02535 [Melioribacteraceae bacterium]|nr:hypothetical protein [Melioribacteraceae bacterium]